jgi:hypothetical protein
MVLGEGLYRVANSLCMVPNTQISYGVITYITSVHNQLKTASYCDNFHNHVITALITMVIGGVGIVT